MPKNLSTVGGATELRFGKNCREDQADNSVVINASNDKIDATKASGFYLTPLEIAANFAEDGTDASTNTFVAYNQSTKQLFRTQIPMTLSGLSGANPSAGGDLNVSGDLVVTGNITSAGQIANISVENTVFKDGLIELGHGNIASDITMDLGHVMSRPQGSSNVAAFFDEDEGKYTLCYTTTTATNETEVNIKTDEDLDVHIQGTLTTTGNVSVGNLILDDSHSNVIQASGNIYTTGNVYIEGGLVTNSGSVSKKTYSHKNDLNNSTSIANATITLTFTHHSFYAKIIAQLFDNNNEEVSTMILDIAGGERGGSASSSTPIAMGPMSIFGNATVGTPANPWSSTVATTGNEITIKPSAPIPAAGVVGKYSIFVEYISHESAGKLTSIERPAGTGDVVNFGY
jgi:hypothetical protein